MWLQAITGMRTPENINVWLQERVPVLQLTRHVANVMQEFTQQGGVRPFGISVLIAGYDDDGPQLFQVRGK